MEEPVLRGGWVRRGWVRRGWVRRVGGFSGRHQRHRWQLEGGFLIRGPQAVGGFWVGARLGGCFRPRSRVSTPECLSRHVMLCRLLCSTAAGLGGQRAGGFGGTGLFGQSPALGATAGTATGGGLFNQSTPQLRNATALGGSLGTATGGIFTNTGGGTRDIVCQMINMLRRMWSME